MTNHLLVFLDSAAEPLLVGEIHFTAKGGDLVSSMFTYDTSFLASRLAFEIDPELPLVAGAQHVTGLPGVMKDCSPDRWGRNLINRNRRALARQEDRRLPTLNDADYLVGVGDLARQGALRFQDAGGGPFLGSDNHVPTFLELPRLLRAADAASKDDDLAAIKELLDAGTGSLGGARPKASVRDGSNLAIAKFPHPDDEWDVMAWEKTALDLASAAGITVPLTRLESISGRGVLVLDRFDRHAEARVPYMSTMTLLSARDGVTHDYLDIAEALAPVSASATADLTELWRRILFSTLVNNTDDHLRNHGLLHHKGGWRLSPAFDMNPNPDAATSRQTSVGGADDRVGVLDALTHCAQDFGLTTAAARDHVTEEVVGAVAQWRSVAARNGITAKEISLFEDAFRPLR